MEKITIFTSTFNREKLLNRCFESLLKQSNKDFIWLIVDDGSTDNTKEYINKIQQQSPFKIIYVYQKNSGKYMAHNNAVKKCKTKYFVNLDSDDILCPNAIEILLSKIEIIDNLSNIAGIIGNSYILNTEQIVGKIIPNIEYASSIELYQKYNFKGDTFRMYKTSVLKDNLFPQIENEKFIPENVVFDKIDVKYKLLVIKEILQQCEYQSSGYSKNINKVRHNNPIGYSLSLKSYAETTIVLKNKINWTLLYIIWCKNFKINGYSEFKFKFRYIILYPIACIFNKMKFPNFLFNSIEGRN